MSDWEYIYIDVFNYDVKISGNTICVQCENCNTTKSYGLQTFIDGVKVRCPRCGRFLFSTRSIDKPITSDMFPIYVEEPEDMDVLLQLLERDGYYWISGKPPTKFNPLRETFYHPRVDEYHLSDCNITLEFCYGAKAIAYSSGLDCKDEARTVANGIRYGFFMLKEPKVQW